MRSRILPLFSCLALSSLSLLTAASCIERAPTPESRRQQFDRSSLKGTVILDSLPKGLHRASGTFGEAVTLAGYEVSPERPKPGDTVEVTFYWRVQQPPEVNYKVFVHGDISGSERRLNGDHWPAKKAYTTDMWQGGEVIRDAFLLRIPNDIDGEVVTLWTGFYNAKQDDIRLPLEVGDRSLTDGKNRLKALSLHIER